MYRIKRRRIIFIGIILCLTLFLTACNTSKKDDAVHSTPIRIGYIQVLSGLPLFVALDNEHFAKVGFDVTATPYKTSDLAIAALQSGEVDLVGIAGLTQGFQLLEKNPNYRIVGINFSSTCLVAGTGPGAPASIADLAGSRIGCFPGNVFQTYTRQALSAEGLDPSTVTIEPIPPPLQIEALKNGKYAALYTLEPTGIMAVHDGVGKYLTKEDLFAKNFLESAKFPGGCSMVSKKYLSANPGSYDSLVAAFNSAMQDIKAQNFDMAPHLRKYMQIKLDYIPILKFEGAEYGHSIDYKPLKMLATKLQDWSLLDSTFSLDAANGENLK